ncbi:MAG TPA: nuclear transport factor 2 family protein [Solirubrobacterales bacterium]|nr:nuclear transport factor 2 family protein [Solirubrobacterales bacterium]
MDVNAAQEAKQVVADICVGIDRLDFDLIRGRVHDDADIDLGLFFKGTGKEFVDWEEGADGPRTLERTMHDVGTQTVAVEGDVAHVTSYVVAYHSGPADHPWCKGFVVFWFHWRDRIERRDGHWALASRRIAFEWGRNETTGEDFPLPEAMFASRDRGDIHYLV